MKRMLKAMSTVLVMTSVLVGCSSSNTVEATTKAATTVEGESASKTEEAPKSDVILKYWAAPLASDEKTKEVWAEVLVGFTEETGITVDVEVVPWADTTKKITTAITSGDGPDIVGTGNNMSISLSASGALMPLTEDIMNRFGGADAFYSNVVGEEGKDPVTLSLNSGVQVMAYNVEAFKEIGLEEIPKDWDSFIDATQKLTKDSDGDGKIDVYGFSMFGKPTQSWKSYYFSFVQHGGELLDAEGVPGFNSQAGAETLQFVGDLIGEYKIAPPASAEWTQDDMLNAFINGQVMSVIISDEHTGVLNSSAIKDNYMVAPLPYILPGKTDGISCSGHVGGTNVGIFAKTKYVEECILFLEYISRPEINEKVCGEFGLMTSVKATMEGKELSEMEQVQVDVLNDGAVVMPQVPYFLACLNSTSTPVQNIMYAAATDTLTPELIQEELEKLDAEVNNTIELSK